MSVRQLWGGKGAGTLSPPILPPPSLFELCCALSVRYTNALH